MGQLFTLLPVFRLIIRRCIIRRTGNLLSNGRLDSDSFDPVTGPQGAFATTNWSQWSDSDTAQATALVSDAERVGLSTPESKPYPSARISVVIRFRSSCPKGHSKANMNR